MTTLLLTEFFKKLAELIGESFFKKYFKREDKPKNDLLLLYKSIIAFRTQIESVMLLLGGIRGSHRINDVGHYYHSLESQMRELQENIVTITTIMSQYDTAFQISAEEAHRQLNNALNIESDFLYTLHLFVFSPEEKMQKVSVKNLEELIDDCKNVYAACQQIEKELTLFIAKNYDWKQLTA